MTNSVWEDEYTGEVYEYYSSLRPVSTTLLPNGYTAVIRVGGDPQTIKTTEPLPESFINQLSLEKIQEKAI